MVLEIKNKGRTKSIAMEASTEAREVLIRHTSTLRLPFQHLHRVLLLLSQHNLR
jgi:hypothetical protein